MAPTGGRGALLSLVQLMVSSLSRVDDQGDLC